MASHLTDEEKKARRAEINRVKAPNRVPDQKTGAGKANSLRKGLKHGRHSEFTTLPLYSPLPPRRQFEVKVQREVLPACTVALTVTRAYQAAAGPAPTTKAAENKEEEPAETTESSEIQSQPYRAKRYTITGPEPIAPPRLGEGNGSQKELPTRPRPSYAPKMAPFQRLANAILNP